MKSVLKKINGAVGIDINGSLYSFAATRSFRPEGRILRQFSDYGIKFFNIFPSGIMTALAKRTVPYSEFGPVWTGIGEYNMDNLRAQCREFFDNISPDVYVSVCVHLDPPQWFVDSHPGMVDHWEQMIQNLGSDEWRNAADDYLRMLVSTLDEWYPGRVYAIFLLSGGTTEWYSYHADTVIESPTELQQAAYRRWCGNAATSIPSANRLRSAADGVLHHPIYDRDIIDYWRFTNETVTDTILHFAHTAKECTDGSKLVGLFNGHSFGLQLDLAVRSSYNELERLLASDDIDMIFCPASYISRRLESTSGIRTPVDTIRDSGKLFVHEIDSSTHLVKNMGGAAAMHAGVRDAEFTCTDDSRMYIRREVGMILAKGEGYWWFDMFSGYYDAPALMDEIRLLHTVQERLLLCDNTSIAEVAEFIDRRSNYMLQIGCRYPMVEHQTEALNRAGAVWEQRLSSDIVSGKCDDKRLYIFPALFAPDAALQKKLSELRRAGRSMLWMHAPGYITDDGFCEEAMRELTGISLRRALLSDNTIDGIGELDGISWDLNNADAAGEVTVKLNALREPARQLSPVFAADGLDIVLGRFRESGEAACGIKFRKDGGADVYSACAPIPASVLAEIYRHIGITANISGDAVVYANRSFACVYAFSDGDVSLTLPCGSAVDCFTKEPVPVRDGKLTLAMKRHETRWLFLD